MLFLEQAAGDLLGPCVRPGARGLTLETPQLHTSLSHGSSIVQTVFES